MSKNAVPTASMITNVAALSLQSSTTKNVVEVSYRKNIVAYYCYHTRWTELVFGTVKSIRNKLWF